MSDTSQTNVLESGTQQRTPRWYSVRVWLLFTIVIAASLCTLTVVFFREESRFYEIEAGLAGKVLYSQKSVWEKDTARLQLERVDKWHSRSNKSRFDFNFPVLADGYELAMNGEAIQDGNLRRIRELRPLQSVSLEGSAITDEGLSQLQDVAELRALDLGGTKITDNGLAYLERMKLLQWLDLRRTGITDAGLGHLHSLQRIEWLGLRSTKITDAGLNALSDMRRLEVLDLTDCGGITEAGVQRLQRERPECKIVH
jgi:hypothetical protein